MNVPVSGTFMRESTLYTNSFEISQFVRTIENLLAASPQCPVVFYYVDVNDNNLGNNLWF